MWQEVLGFCPFNEYAQLVGLHCADHRRPARRWSSHPASSEFYFLLKMSLLEMRFRTALPSPTLGGLWLASRGPEAKMICRLRMGLDFSLLHRKVAALAGSSFSSFWAGCSLRTGTDGRKSVSRERMECVNEVVPFSSLRVLHVYFVHVRRRGQGARVFTQDALLDEMVTESVAPLAGLPGKCLVTLCREKDCQWGCPV